MQSMATRDRRARALPPVFSRLNSNSNSQLKEVRRMRAVPWLVLVLFLLLLVGSCVDQARAARRRVPVIQQGGP